jgi:endogenous inhibitor of DNA gyrase (YacG/DUF329 family)
MAEPKLRCSTCRKIIEGRPQNPTFPFCSERCRLVDLGRWRGEEDRIPTQETPVSDDGDDGGETAAYKPN